MAEMAFEDMLTIIIMMAIFPLLDGKEHYAEMSIEQQENFMLLNTLCA